MRATATTRPKGGMTSNPSPSVSGGVIRELAWATGTRGFEHRAKLRLALWGATNVRARHPGRESLAAKLRAGNAASNTTSDHIEVLTDAIVQIPGTHRKKLVVRSHGAGESHGLLDWLTEQSMFRGRSVEYSPASGGAPRSGSRSPRSCARPSTW